MGWAATGEMDAAMWKVDKYNTMQLIGLCLIYKELYRSALGEVPDHKLSIDVDLTILFMLGKTADCPSFLGDGLMTSGSVCP